MRALFALALAAACMLAGQVQAKNIKVKSWCPITHAVGFGQGPSFEVAKDAAIKACLANGGLAKCCYKFYRQV